MENNLYHLKDLHPLALEDIFHTRSQTRSKADYYTKHLFLRVLCHELGQNDGPAIASPESMAFDSMLMHNSRSDSPSAMSELDISEKEAMREEDNYTMYDSASGPMSRREKKRGRFFPFIRATQDLEGNLASIGSSQASLGKLVSGVTMHPIYELFVCGLFPCRLPSNVESRPKII